MLPLDQRTQRQRPHALEEGERVEPVRRHGLNRDARRLDRRQDPAPYQHLELRVRAEVLIHQAALPTGAGAHMSQTEGASGYHGSSIAPA